MTIVDGGIIMYSTGLSHFFYMSIIIYDPFEYVICRLYYVYEVKSNSFNRVGDELQI